MRQSSSGIRILGLLGALIALATMAAYWQVTENDFVNFDDDVYVTGNLRIQTGSFAEKMAWAFTSFDNSNWHPVTWLSHILDWRLFGDDPTGHHAMNLGIHILSAVLLLLVLARMTGRVWESAFVAALFAVHPLHVESVAWVAERKDVLSTLFWILTMWAYVRYAERPVGRRYFLVLLLFGLGLMAKPMLVSLPIVLLLLDYWPLGRMASRGAGKGRSFRALLVEKIPLFAMSAASSVVTYIAQQTTHAMKSFSDIPLAARLENALVSYARYLGKMFWPTDLAVFYPHPVGGWPLMYLAGAALVLLCISALIGLNARKHPYLVVGWLWYIITLVPVIGIVQVGSQAMADRYTYVPLIGCFVAISWGASELLRWTWERGKKKDSRDGKERTGRVTALTPRVAIPTVLAVGIIAVLVILTRAQVRVWRDSITLFTHALEVTEDNAVAHTNLGVELAMQGSIEEAMAHYREAIRIDPKAAQAYNNLGMLLDAQGKGEEAVPYFEKALSIAPRSADACNNLGTALMHIGQVELAIEYFRKAIELNPRLPGGHVNLANALSSQFKFEEASRHYRLAMRLQPNDARIPYNYGAALHFAGKLNEAEALYRKAIGIDPDLLPAYLGLASVLYRKGDYDGAWDAVGELDRRGGAVPPEFLRRLSEHMPSR